MSAEPTPIRRRAAPQAIPNRCPDAADMSRIADALERVADNIEKIAPTLEVMHDFAERFEKLCLFMRKWAPRVLWLAPVIFTVSNAISPELADAIKTIIIRIAATPAAGS